MLKSAVRMDPEGTEIRAMRKYVPTGMKDVLEIGCGDGRLTFQYAPSTRSTVAIDPKKASVKVAKKELAKSLASKLRFQVGRGEELEFPDESFDVVFFAWSLCCTDIPAMGKAVGEAWRVLRPRGILASIQPSLQQPFPYGMVGYLIDRNSGPVPEDEAYAHSRLALRHAAFVEGKFSFVAEAEFPTYTYYRSEREVLKDFLAERGEEYRALDNKTKQLVRESILQRETKTKKGIRVQDNAVLTVLRKRTQ